MMAWAPLYLHSVNLDVNAISSRPNTRFCWQILDFYNGKVPLKMLCINKNNPYIYYDSFFKL